MEDFREFDEELMETTEVQEKKASFGDKVKDFGGKVWSKTKSVAKSVKDDPEKLLTGLAVAGTGLLVLVGIKQQKEIERTVYDDEIGECVQLRRKLKNSDKIELARRMDEEDVSKTTALNEMNLIK